MKLKICGMKHNTAEVAALKPDYLGFIFWEPSARNFDKESIASIPEDIKKIGVFVDAPLDFVVDKIKSHDLDGVQLHGKEDRYYCLQLESLFARLQRYSIDKGVFYKGQNRLYRFDRL